MEKNWYNQVYDRFFMMDVILDDEGQKKIRGKRNDFTKSFENIQKVIDLKRMKGFQTKIVVTMIAMGASNDDVETQRNFMEIFNPLDVFNYVKSQDNRWYYEDDKEIENKSHYVSEYCEYPWTSLTVMANGEVVPCTQDFDTEMTLQKSRPRERLFLDPGRTGPKIPPCGQLLEDFLRKSP